MAIPERYERKISANGQISLPVPYRLSEEWYIPESGILNPEDVIRLHPSSHPPVWHGAFDGEQLLVTLTSQGQVTIPAKFRKQAGFPCGDYVTVERLENGVIELSRT